MFALAGIIVAVAFVVAYVPFFVQRAKKGTPFSSFDIVMIVVSPIFLIGEWKAIVPLVVVFGPIVGFSPAIGGEFGWFSAPAAWALAATSATFFVAAALSISEADRKTNKKKAKKDRLKNSLAEHRVSASGKVVSFVQTGRDGHGRGSFLLSVDVGSATVEVPLECVSVEIANWLQREVQVEYDSTNHSNAIRITPKLLKARKSATEAAKVEKRIARQQAIHSEMAESGLSAKSIVIDSSVVKILSDPDAMILALETRVEPLNGESFVRKFDAAVGKGRAVALSFRKGETVWVRYDPNDVDKTALDAEKPQGTGG